MMYPVVWGCRIHAWNPNMALNQSSRFKSPALCLCCSNVLGQLKPRVFHSTEIAALIYNMDRNPN